ncbi:kelch repeat-containing protein [Stigmatella sp. ncwal1]|uniref:Kelch repeat-containing protein n=1 Tax=Stigmatella ashevillensis TaxID=2995309 RepID=A0ABT5DKI8_9BACT|nr:kelch repeat-containing protein [Stigmatella ashevillena]MDC0714180.1 kelch repeat-containing protein [Stigmatella ashevillena]
MKNRPISLLAFCLALAVIGCHEQPSPSPSDDFSLRVVLAETRISAGMKTIAKAQRVYDDGRVVDLDASTSQQWTSSAPQVASVELQPDGTVKVTALKPGSAIITVNADEASGEATLEVTAARLLSLQVSPSIASVSVGITQQFTAQGSYSDGSTVDVTSSATWTTSDTAIATVSSTGLGTGVAAGGPVTITATLGGVSGTAQLTITPPPPVLTSIKLTPTTASVLSGSTQQFTAQGSYSDGTTVDVTTRATWTTSNSAIATVSSTGLGTGVAVGGPVTITATLGGVSGTAQLSVTGWTSAGAMSMSRYNHTATRLDSGRVIIAGGRNGTTTLSSVELYDPATNSWSLVSAMSKGRFAHAAVLLSSGYVFVTGGVGALTSAEMYDPESNSWFLVSPMSGSRYGHTLTLLSSGQVLVTGGIDGNNAVATVEVFEPLANIWVQHSVMSTARFNHTATLLPSGKVLVSGGTNGSGSLSSAEVYDPATNTWAPAGAMVTRHSLHAATLLPSGKVLISGGQSLAEPSSSELYDPATNSWSAAGSMVEGRSRHAATLLSSGQVLVAGGDGSSYYNTAELYNPATSSWSATISMAESRGAHTATLLTSGRILVVGGEDGTHPLATAEVYVP